MTTQATQTCICGAKTDFPCIQAKGGNVCHSMSQLEDKYPGGRRCGYARTRYDLPLVSKVKK